MWIYCWYLRPECYFSDILSLGIRDTHHPSSSSYQSRVPVFQSATRQSVQVQARTCFDNFVAVLGGEFGSTHRWVLPRGITSSSRVSGLRTFAGCAARAGPGSHTERDSRLKSGPPFAHLVGVTPYARVRSVVIAATVGSLGRCTMQNAPMCQPANSI